MDLDAVADELYGLAPGDFTTVRDERAQAARAAGDRELAARIRRLRRPTLAAWASNLLVREQPDETERLLQLGEALRRAHQDLDGARLRELSARQHQLTFALAQQAGELAAQAGQSFSDDVRQEVQDTLHAALADSGAAEQLAEGRLTKPLSVVAGFPVPSGQPAQGPAPRRTTRPASEVGDLDAARVRRQEQQKQERLELARQKAADVERELRDREGELATAEEEQRRAEAEQRQAEQRVAELSRQLQDAERAQQRAGDAVGKARERTRDADRAVRDSRRRGEDAAAHVRELAGRTPHRP
ncbi:hypothetical protein PV396_22465 [Streptomyces sp. ME02-8801-2C]|uniref:hypothetical protein n=1 Tax=Streptomyces sp. ME02-8801-2C TaxID=3028680 RepID=UPI0029B2B9F3|nr:hypothetical protein [Streptomyces sp. ME02-8801-2C]MDX3454673.1 hypothetical protein [Streptomyces sp. ME02-8801-2C]